MATHDKVIPVNLPALDYGLPLPLHKRRWFQRRIIAAAMAILLALLFSPWWAVSIWQNAQLCYGAIRLDYLQNQCLSHPVAGGSLIYSSGPPGVAIASPQLNRFLGTYQNWWMWGGNLNMATIYIGRRQASNGAPCFVAVGMTIALRPGQRADIYFPVLTRPLGLTTPRSPGIRSLTVGHGFNWGSSASPEILVHSAVEDPADPSHFSFTYEGNTWRTTVDCWLQPNGHVRSNEKEVVWFTTPQGNLGKIRPN